MLSNPHFYNRTIRKIVVAFGSMFNDIEVVRFLKDGTPTERFKVPLSYGAKEKYITRITSDPSLTKSIATVVPRISFNLEGLSYDASRKQVTTLKNFGNGGGTFSSQYAPVPYDFNFTMSLYVRNTEDGTQILEQILPFFTPDFTVTIDFIPSMNQKYDMPVILNSVNSTVDYEGDMMSTRLILWDLDFTAKGYIWPAVRSDSTNGKIIRYANTNFYNMANTKLVNILTTPDPISANIDDEYGFNEEITDYYNNLLDGEFVNPDPLPGAGAFLYDTSDPLVLNTLGTPFTANSNLNISTTVLVPGLSRKKYKGYYEENPNWFNGKTPIDIRNDDIVSFNYSDMDDQFSMLWTGYFKPSTTGDYNFWLVSDDSNYMWIGDTALSGYTNENAFVNNGSEHSNQWRNNQNSVTLTAGKYYPIRIHFGEKGSYETMQVFYALAGSAGTRNFTNKLYHNSITNGF
jgi:hypothetical protein